MSTRPPTAPAVAQDADETSRAIAGRLHLVRWFVGAVAVIVVAVGGSTWAAARYLDGKATVVYVDSRDERVRDGALSTISDLRRQAREHWREFKTHAAQSAVRDTRLGIVESTIPRIEKQLDRIEQKTDRILRSHHR